MAPIGGTDIEGFDWDDYITRMIPAPPTMTSITSLNQEGLEIIIGTIWSHRWCQLIGLDLTGQIVIFPTMKYYAITGAAHWMSDRGK